MNSFQNTFILFDSAIGSLPEFPSLLWIDGKQNLDFIKLFKFLKKELTLPNYSQPNLDSLDEILNDPDWIEERMGLRIMIKNYPNLLFKEMPTRKKSFITILNSMASSFGYETVWIEDCAEIREDLIELGFSFKPQENKTPY